MAETLATVSMISFIASGIFFVVSVLIWFLFGIPSVIGDLSGRTARKSIERMWRENENKNIPYTYNKVDTVNASDAIENVAKQSMDGDETLPLMDGSETLPLMDDNATLPLKHTDEVIG